MVTQITNLPDIKEVLYIKKYTQLKKQVTAIICIFLSLLFGNK